MKIKVGDKLYVRSSFYLSHGKDDFVGGIATVKSIDDKNFIEFEENVGTFYNPDCLLKKQKDLKKEFKNKKAHKLPDNRPEFNRWD